MFEAVGSCWFGWLRSSAFWNDGDMYILEKKEQYPDDEDDSTDSNEGYNHEMGSFHVAVVCWRLRPASAA